DRPDLVHQLDRVLLQLFDVRPLDQDVEPIALASAATAPGTAAPGSAAARGGRARDVGAARDADARALILPKHRARLTHEDLWRDVAGPGGRQGRVKAGKPG